MPKRAKATAAKAPGSTVLPIRCMGCGTPSTTMLPGAAPWPAGVFREEGWSVLNEPEEGHIVFACKSCFDAEMHPPKSKIHGKG